MSEQPEALELISLFELEADPESLYRRAATELRRLHAESNEQARLNGMGAERELVLRAKVKQLERRIQATTLARQQAQEALYADRDRCAKEVQRLQAEIGRLSACHSQNETCALQESLSLVAAPQAWSPAYTRGPARQSATVAAAPALVLLSEAEIAKLIPGYLSESWAIEQAGHLLDHYTKLIAKLNGLTVGDGGDTKPTPPFDIRND